MPAGAALVPALGAVEAAAAPTAKVIVPSSVSVSVSCSPAIANVLAVPSEWTNRKPSEASLHIAIVETPGVIVIPFEPAVL